MAIFAVDRFHRIQYSSRSWYWIQRLLNLAVIPFPLTKITARSRSLWTNHQSINLPLLRIIYACVSILSDSRYIPKRCLDHDTSRTYLSHSTLCHWHGIENVKTLDLRLQQHVETLERAVSGVTSRLNEVVRIVSGISRCLICKRKTPFRRRRLSVMTWSPSMGVLAFGA